MQEIAFKEKFLQYRLKLLMLAGMVAGIAAPAAAEVNWTNITTILTGVASIFPAFITLIEAAVPIIIVMAVVGFVVTFMDKILDMLKMR